MIHQIFTVFDSKTAAYLPPFYLPTKGAAIRALQDTLQDPQHQFARHPEDYTLFHIGNFEDTDASIVTFEAGVSLGSCLELMAENQTEEPK